MNQSILCKEKCSPKEVYELYLSLSLLLLESLHFFHHLERFLHVSLRALMLRLGQLFTDFLSNIMHIICL